MSNEQIEMEHLDELIEIEYKHMMQQEVGSEEYIKSANRLAEFEKKSADIISVKSGIVNECLRTSEEMSNNKKNRVLTVAKILADGLLCVGGWAVCVKEQKDITFTGALKDMWRCIIPKKP